MRLGQKTSESHEKDFLGLNIHLTLNSAFGIEGKINAETSSHVFPPWLARHVVWLACFLRCFSNFCRVLENVWFPAVFVFPSFLGRPTKKGSTDRFKTPKVE